MPIHRVVKNGKPGFQWGNHGKVYTYKSGDIKSRRSAKAKAEKQAIAIYQKGYREKKKKMLV